MTEEEKRVIELAVREQPLILLAIKDEELLKYANSFLPYSVGFEIECDQNPDNFNKKHFITIPNIMDVSIDSEEQRFRIPPGIEGLTCLWHISETLKINSFANLESGIHYHIDLTRNWKLITIPLIKENEKEMLEELDKWKYKGTYNERGVTFDEYNSCGRSFPWIRFQEGFKTAEIRIGEMTFDYKVLVDRMISASAIIRKFVDKIGGTTLALDNSCPNASNVLNFSYIVKHKAKREAEVKHLYEELKELKKVEVPVEEDIEAIVRNRIINKN